MLSADGSAVPEDLLPSSEKVGTVADGYMVHNMSGIRVQITSRLDGKGYDIAKRKSCANIYFYVVILSLS